MPVPNMRGAFRGWTQKTNVDKVTQTVVNHKTVEVKESIVLDCNFQPMPTAQVNRKPEEQRTWKWWLINVKDGELLQVDDIIIKDSKSFRIQNFNDWSESGFQKYEAIEDYTNG